MYKITLWNTKSVFHTNTEHYPSTSEVQMKPAGKENLIRSQTAPSLFTTLQNWLIMFKFNFSNWQLFYIGFFYIKIRKLCIFETEVKWYTQWGMVFWHTCLRYYWKKQIEQKWLVAVCCQSVFEMWQLYLQQQSSDNIQTKIIHSFNISV